jgi:hypothetical protein
LAGDSAVSRFVAAGQNAVDRGSYVFLNYLTGSVDISD